MLCPIFKRVKNNVERRYRPENLDHHGRLDNHPTSTVGTMKRSKPCAVHPHEVGVHFDRVTSSWVVERALALVELDQNFPFNVMDVCPLDYLVDVEEALRKQLSGTGAT